MVTAGTVFWIEESRKGQVTCTLYNVGADHMYINNLFISNIGNFFLGSLVQPETNIYIL